MIRALLILATLLLSLPACAEEFRAEQLKLARVKAAQQRTGAAIQKRFLDQKLSWPPRGLLLRVFKADEALELWTRTADGTYALVHEYPICASSGVLGPKRREGDLQVPEGFYSISHFNPASIYHLSLKVSYPNASDRILGGKGRLGGDIFIHGKCCTIGCVPLGDEAIEEVYLAALEARAAGHPEIPVLMFPTRMTADNMARLAREHAGDAELLAFWANLKEGHDLFEQQKRPPKVSVDPQGRYRFAPRSAKTSETSKPPSPSRTR